MAEWVEFGASAPGQRAVVLVRNGITTLEDADAMLARAIEPLVSVLLAAGVAESLAQKRAEEATAATAWLLRARRAIVEDAWTPELEERLASVRAVAVELAQEAAAAAREAGSLRGDVAALRAL